MAEEKQEKQKDGKIAKIIEVPTQMGFAIELEDGTRVSDAELLVRIYNKMLKIEKSL